MAASWELFYRGLSASFSCVQAQYNSVVHSLPVLILKLEVVSMINLGKPEVEFD
jgi:hypothetical protein